MRVDLSFDLAPMRINTPIADSPAGWITLRVADTLDQPSGIALEALFNLMSTRFGLDRPNAVALAWRSGPPPDHPDRQPDRRRTRRSSARRHRRHHRVTS
jgi:hypothetical protein